jgi:hypothetical protein
MRLNLRLTGNADSVPFDDVPQLTGALHKWLEARNPGHKGK